MNDRANMKERHVDAKMSKVVRVVVEEVVDVEKSFLLSQNPVVVSLNPQTVTVKIRLKTNLIHKEGFVLTMKMITFERWL